MSFIDLNHDFIVDLNQWFKSFDLNRANPVIWNLLSELSKHLFFLIELLIHNVCVWFMNKLSYWNKISF